jgi:hypothetical protein
LWDNTFCGMVTPVGRYARREHCNFSVCEQVELSLNTNKRLVAGAKFKVVCMYDRVTAVIGWLVPYNLAYDTPG